MIVHPNDKNVRRYISPERYSELFDSQKGKTFIGQSLDVYDENSIKARIVELSKLEEEFGFVYVAEKYWLSDYIIKKTDNSRYHLWVERFFLNELGLNFDLVDYSSRPDFPSKAWKSTLCSAEELLLFNDIRNPLFDYSEIDELDLFVCGDEKEMYPSHIVKLYELLHDLEYILFGIYPDKWNEGSLSLEGIDVATPESATAWNLNVYSDCGTDFNIVVSDRKHWRH